MQTIEIDCAPGMTRPGDLIEEVIKDTGLPAREPVSRLFGNWTWDYSDVPAEQWQASKELRKARIKELYEQGVIRYGSW